MKIVKGVGEWLLPSWLRAELRPVLAFAGAGTALWTGSAVLAVWVWRRLREHLDPRESAAALLTAGYLAGYGCVHAPHIASFAIPGAILAWCVAAWCMAPADGTAPKEPGGEPDPQDITDLVRDLIGDDKGVLLTALCQPLHAPHTRAVRELLAAAGVRVRPGVRTFRGNGPGVHRDDLPAPSPPPADPPAAGVLAGESANANANNRLRVEAREGMTIINDPADRHRAYSLKKAP